MSRRMSCALTADAVRDRTKTVTRRAVGTWATLKPGDRLTLIEKGMGLKKGEKQVILAEVEIVDVRIEPLISIWGEDTATAREGLAEMSSNQFVWFWLNSHGCKTVWTMGAYGAGCYVNTKNGATPLREFLVRRIEWRYPDEAQP